MKGKLILDAFLTFFFILGSVAVSTAAAVISVDSNGGENYSSIQEAIDNAQEGDTILVNPGIYKENVKVDKKISILANSSSEAPGKRTYVLGTVSDEDVFYVNSNNVTIDGFFISGVSSGGEEYEVGIYLEGVENCSLSNNALIMNDVGISLAGAKGNYLVNNLVSLGYQGIALENSEENTLLGNLVLTNDKGILLYNSANNTLMNNTADSNMKGLSLETSDMNSLMSNTISKNEYGIFSLMSESNVLFNNSLYLNGVGLYFNDSSDNTVYMNDFFNHINAEDDGTNFWNISSTGNYWEKYSGEDANGDRIGDTPYVINETTGSKDYMPLMNETSSYEVSENESEVDGNETFVTN
ncbi:Cell surface protein [Methanosarcina siciliae HI350]|uniref:Cell surface protein n=1 Tax=Methanosarcina siciliae HI350 TaxID=1434119 RepID=A0A0E3PF15_9EURY|nr:NosD domain-containing protein [Methanosarcina siciliae]AKB32472.1 Cell surface protein [Methanosarcina siciliae HI350]